MYGCSNSGPVYSPAMARPRYFDGPRKSLDNIIGSMHNSIQSLPIYNNISYINTNNIPKLAMYDTLRGLEKYVRNFVSNHFYSSHKNLEYLSNNSYGSIQTGEEITHDPEVFLADNRPKTEFVEKITPHLKKQIRTIFRLTTNSELPGDILISVLDSYKFEKEHNKHSRFFSRFLQGFALNRKHLYDLSSVFIKQNPLDSLMLTIGHEIGHCLSFSKKDPILEEAKAFAFELAWMKTIRKHNIMGLRDSMNISILNPAQNGLHNVALDFVLSKLDKMNPMEIFRMISANR